MQIVEEKYTPTKITDVLRSLKLLEETAFFELGKRQVVDTIASKLKAREGLVFKVNKVGDMVKVNKISEP